MTAPNRRKLQPCGTPGAYQRHLYYGETPCRPCTDARAAQSAQWRRQRQNLGAAATAALFRELLDLISAECRRAGMLPAGQATKGLAA